MSVRALLSLNGALQAGYLFPWHSLSVVLKLSVLVNNVDPKWLTQGKHVILLEVPPKELKKKNILDIKMHLSWTSTLSPEMEACLGDKDQKALRNW